MESIVNYESDDGNIKLTNKSSRKSSAHNQEKRRSSSDDDSSDLSSPCEQKQKVLKEDDNRSARYSSYKSSAKYEKKSYKRRQRRDSDSSKDSDRYERKRMKNRDDTKEYREKKRRDRSNSRERSEYSGKDRYRDRSSERRKERYDNHRRHKFDEKRDCNQRREESTSTHRKIIRNSNDARSSLALSKNSAIRRAEALNRTIERRANEKVHQLQKLGIEIPGLMQQQQQPQLHFKSQSPPNMQIKALMSIDTGTTSGASQIALTTSTTSVETAAENDVNLTLNLSNFTSSVLTNARYTEQLHKKKLIWGSKKTTSETATTNNKWEAAKFSQDSDGKVASKFLRLMGMKNAPAVAAKTSDDGNSSVENREKMFSSMEQQYEIARQATHTMRGMGLGFGSQSRP